MSDYREDLYRKIIEPLILSDEFSPTQIAKLKDVVSNAISNFEVTERCTELSTVDQSSEMVLKLYLGTLASERYSDTSISEYRRIITRFYYAINKPLVEANVFDLRMYLLDMEKKISPQSCENYRSYICAFYSWLAREGILQKNPMEKIKRIAFIPNTEEPYTDLEIDTIRSCCPNLRVECEVLLLLSTGARISEVVDLDISDIDFQTLKVKIKDGKGGKPRIVYTNAVCASYLQKYLATRTDSCPSLFVSRLGKRLSRRAIAADMTAIAEETGIHVHAHRFRKTFASVLKRRGVDITTIQKLLGHTSIDTTLSYYVHIADDAIKYEYMMKA